MALDLCWVAVRSLELLGGLAWLRWSFSSMHWPSRALLCLVWVWFFPQDGFSSNSWVSWDSFAAFESDLSFMRSCCHKWLFSFVCWLLFSRLHINKTEPLQTPAPSWLLIIYIPSWTSVSLPHHTLISIRPFDNFVQSFLKNASLLYW